MVLARDGVINEYGGECIRSPEEWHAIPGSLDAIARLNRAGYRVVVTTNQAGLRGKALDVETLNLVHQRMQQELAETGGRFEAIFICACLPDEDCPCYGPEPSMLHDIAARLRTSLESVPMVAGTLRDMEAGLAVGARVCAVRTGPAFDDETFAVPAGVEVHDSLSALAEVLIERGGGSGAG
ncbi:MAG: HAD-IIIA family hydrolase [Gammaproteobacteria bacterium]|nr:HAD-IIIA family hydrolase [Gammaproteobacteria bacterium]